MNQWLFNRTLQALTEWVKGIETLTLEQEVEEDLEFIRSSWDDLRRHKGKFVVAAQHELQGVFEYFAEARKAASGFRVAHTFRVAEKPVSRVVELGPEMEVR